MKMTFGIFVLLFCLLVFFLAWSSYPWSINESKKTPPVLEVNTQNFKEFENYPSVIKVLTFNIGFLYGRGSEGPGYEHRDKDYYLSSLDKISQEIKNWDVDIVCLQEVDFHSARSHYLNQAQIIAKEAGFPYLAEAHSWEANYIPFPYWPIKNHFGHMKSGGAILSKFPLTNYEVTLLDKPESQPWWYNLFYLHRYFQKVTITLGDKNINLINVHLEAFDKVDREKQVKKLVAKAKSEKIDLLLGDFNILPTVATKKSKFFNDDNYENDSSYEILASSGYLDVIPSDIYAKDEMMYFTFPAWAPDRRLDYIWYKSNYKMMKAEILFSASSDHLPLRASFQIDGPRFNPYSQ